MWTQGLRQSDIGGLTASFASKRMAVVLDAMAGAYTHIAPRVLDSAGYAVTSLTPEVDPDYAAGNPDPSHDANLQPLIEAVIVRGADVAVAWTATGTASSLSIMPDESPGPNRLLRC